MSKSHGRASEIREGEGWPRRRRGEPESGSDIAVFDRIYIGLGDRFDDDRRRVRLAQYTPPLK